jgi:predicted SAM-dependent methyltransferase
MAEAPLKLHLGCGEHYLDGYVNIDFPPSEHSVQTTSVADQLADITRLEYEPGSVAEIRLHHVFEHFDRPTALRLLVDWRTWLAKDGELRLETPDFERCARVFARRFGLRRRRGVLLRHVFGSHEAAWAVHWDGWYEARYRETLGALGFTDLRFDKASWRGTYNITVRARPDGVQRTREQLLEAAEGLLRASLVDDSASEQRLLAHWVSELRGAPSPTPR